MFQIRDVAPAPEGRGDGDLRRAPLRLFTHDLLPGLETVRRRGDGRASSEVAWSQGRSQTLGRGDGLRGNGCGQESGTRAGSSFRARQGSFQYLDPSSQPRTGASTTPKKTTQVSASALPCGNEELREGYEELRLQALTQESGGLGRQLFQHRGMAAWMHYGSCVAEGKTSARDKSVHEGACSVRTRTDIVVILAGMALSCAKEGRER